MSLSCWGVAEWVLGRLVCSGPDRVLRKARCWAASSTVASRKTRNGSACGRGWPTCAFHHDQVCSLGLRENEVSCSNSFLRLVPWSKILAYIVALLCSGLCDFGQVVKTLRWFLYLDNKDNMYPPFKVKIKKKICVILLMLMSAQDTHWEHRGFWDCYCCWFGRYQGTEWTRTLTWASEVWQVRVHSVTIRRGS